MRVVVAHRRMRFNRTVRTTEATIDSRTMTMHPRAPPTGLTSHLPILMDGSLPAARRDATRLPGGKRASEVRTDGSDVEQITHTHGISYVSPDWGTNR
jgi:hypothetical protein